MKSSNQAARQAPIKRVEVLRPLAALADDTRLRILELLAEGGELRGQDVITELDSSQPNVSRHLKQLVSAGLVSERRAGDANKWYRMNPDAIAQLHQLLAQLLTPENVRAVREMETEREELVAAQQAQPEALRGLLDVQGRVMSISNKAKDRDAKMRYLITKFALGRDYTEKEVNAVLAAWVHKADVAWLRRTLFEMKLIDRTLNGSRYWRTA